MQKQEKQHLPSQLSKKKKKNKGWQQPTFQQAANYPTKQPQIPIPLSLTSPSNLQQEEIDKNTTIQVKKLSQMASKYHIEMSIQLGSGFASVVYLGQNIQTQQPVCVKVIDYFALGGEKARQILKKQIKSLSKFDCESIVRLFDVYESPSFCYLVMQFCQGGDLFKFVMTSKPLSTLAARNFIQQICVGLLQMKKKQLIHRDLKTQNIFLSKKLQAKIGDLGFCVEQTEEKIIHNVGSPIYMSPQVMSGVKHTFESDIYGLGVIWFELLHKRAPWQGKSQEQLLSRKLNQKLEFFRQDLSEKDKMAISKCLSLNPQDRWNIQQLIAQISPQNLEELSQLKAVNEAIQKIQVKQPKILQIPKLE